MTSLHRLRSFGNRKVQENHTPRPVLTVPTILKTVAAFYGTTVGPIVGPSRAHNITYVRAVAMYLARRFTRLSYPELGRAFGNRHHTTVVIAVQKVEYHIERDVQLLDDLCNLFQHLYPKDTPMAPADAALLKIVPLADETEAETQEPTLEVAPQTPTPAPRARRHMPPERFSITHKFTIANCEGYLIVGLYEDMTPGEIFLRIAKEGSTLGALVDGWAKMVSIGLQTGTTVEDLVARFAGARFEPMGYTKNPAIPEATSIYDYVVRYLGLRFIKP